MADRPPKYRFCWWCSRQLQGPFGRECHVNGTPVRVHAECVGPMRADGNDVTDVVELKRKVQRG
jgi:hypothetical protein